MKVIKGADRMFQHFPLPNLPSLTSLPALQVALVVRNPPANAGDKRDSGSIPGSGRSSGRGHSNPLHYSCLENPADRGTWGATVHRVIELDTTEQLT